MFSKACEYGIRALTIIAKEGEKGKNVGIKEICKSSKSPEAFTAKILQNLVKKKILGSKKGPSGGFFIARPLKEVTLYEIVVAIDGKDLFTKCGLGLVECNANKPCPIHHNFETVRGEILEMCHNSSLNKLIEGLHLNVYEQ